MRRKPFSSPKLVPKRRLRQIKRIGKAPVFAVPVVTFVALLAVTVVGFFLINGGKPSFKPTDASLVTITDDHQERTVPTHADNVGELLERLDITLDEGDVVEPTANTEIVGDNFRVNIYRAVPVTIVDGDRKTFTYSAASTPRSIIKRTGVEVYPEDNLKLLPATNFLAESSIGERVVIERATPVSLNLYGTPLTVRTHVKTVGELLKEKKVSLGKDDTVQPAAKTPLTPQTQIFLIRKGIQIVSEEQAIPMPSETVEDASLSFGTTAVRQQGSNGKKVITYQLQLQNGKEIGRKQIQEVVTQEPVKQIVARGKAVSIPNDKQAVMALAGISPSDYPYVDFIVSHESGWCPTKMQGNPGACPPYPPASMPSSLGYGLGQATPGTKMAPYGADWQTSAVTQLKWGTAYASRYGGWKGAYDAWRQHAVERTGRADYGGWW